MGRLFGTSGIRGPAETLFTNQLCFDLGRAFSIFLKNHNQQGMIAVGMDPRATSQRIKEYFASGLIYEKVKVLDEGITPVPAINWILMSSDVIASAMITGSHIKKELNGIKFFAFRDEILKDHETEISALYESIKEKIASSNNFSIASQDKSADILYIKMLRNLIDQPYPNLKVILDPGNGAQTEVMPAVLKDSGLDLVSVNNDSYENMLARDTEVEEDFATLKRQVVEGKADLGIAYDSDGDRAVFIDKNGSYIPGEYSSSLIAKYEETEKIVVTFNTSQVVEKIGKQVIRTKVGSPYVVEEMKKSGARFGFEANGGGIFADIMYSRDGGSTTIKMLNLMIRKKKSLDELIDELPKFFLYKEKVDCPWEKDKVIFEAVREKYQGLKIEELDGMKVWFSPSSWVLFRSSQNAPEFRVFAEAKKQDEAFKLGKDGLQLVKEIISSE